MYVFLWIKKVYRIVSGQRKNQEKSRNFFGKSRKGALNKNKDTNVKCFINYNKK